MKLMKTTYAIGMLTAAALVLQACGSKETEKAAIPAEIIPVKVMPLVKADVSNNITASGQFSTDDETLLSFKTGGIINKILVQEGDLVQKGQLLATLDLTEIKSLVSQAQLGHEKAERDFTRVSHLFNDGVATLEQMQNAQTGLDLANQQLATARFNLKYSEIRAVAKGYILRKMANAGQLVQAGTPIFQTNGAGQSDWFLKVGVSDAEWNLIQVGDQATIEADVLKDSKAKAKVVRKSEGTDPYSGSFTVELLMDQKANIRFASGMFGTATITPASKSNVWSIPYDALLDGNANTGYVFVTDDNKTVQKVQVKIASIEKQMVRIASGLENHKNLIVSGSAYLNEQSTIVISK